MKIAIVASEAAPFVKTGGLGDVMQALPQALARLPKNEVSLFLPCYSRMKAAGKFELDYLDSFEVELNWRRVPMGLFRLKSRKKKLQVYFIDCGQYFDREQIYGCIDDGERFAFFSKAVLTAMDRLELRPDIINCNDWQTALIPLLLKEQFRDRFPGTKTVFTIHNIEYQGWCGLDFGREVLGLPERCDGILRFDGSVNFMKAAIMTADKVSTVSANYAHELQYPYYAHGLAGVLAGRAEDFSGITNGIDMEVFDPGRPELIARAYGVCSLREGKRENKLALQKTLGLPEDGDTALLAMVTRLAGHKGIDLLCYIAERLMQRRIQLVIIGTGEDRYEWFLSGLAKRFPEQASVNLCFNAELANQVYAASDLYLMPSKSEPCGLSQLIAMRFGSVPVVNATGGLKDTVAPYCEADETGRGFTFQSYNADDFLAAIDRALAVYYNDPDKWLRLAENDMKLDSGWQGPARQYMALYQSAMEK